MAIIDPRRDVNLTTVLSGNSYINLPITAGISPYGYWYYYNAVNAGNTGIPASIKPYQWATPLPLKNAATNMTIQGTFALLTETWDGATVKYHGGCIEWIGPGTNDITNAIEDDAFFFAHLGTLSTSPTDDIFYWDRAFDPEQGADWEYYQYHAHSPTFYPTYENGREVIGGNGWIDPLDKAYGYMITTQVRVQGVTYSSVMARVHTPSVGGAHNSHNDTTLPTTGNKNYMPGGMIRGVGERYHCFYIAASGGDWEVFNRTYLDSAASFTAQVSLGVFNLADPTFNPSANQQSQYPVRAGAGTTFGARIYFPVILNNSVSGFDLEIWSFNSLDTIAGGSLVRQVLASGVSVRPDCFCATLGTQALYALFTNVPTGGLKLYKFNGTTWSDSGNFLTNNAADPIRVHGFQFNSQDFRWYALLSGTASGGGSTYLGPGMYSFELDDAFTGYEHLDYDSTTNSFVVRAPLANGYAKYTPTLATYTRVNAQEPKAIPADTLILNYAQPSNQWFNKKSVGFGGGDFYYHSITLSDGRRFACGQVTNNPGNQGSAGSGDFLVSVYKADLSSAIHLAAGTTGDDYLTGCWEDADNRRIWMSGYCKGQVVPKGDIWIHGWCRNLSDGGSAMEWTDIATDSSGNVYLVGKHVDGWLITAKYDRDYNLIWQKRIGDNDVNTDVGLGIAVDSDGNIYICGSTQEAGQGLKDALLIKMAPTGTITWAKVYGTASDNSATSVCCVVNGVTQYVVMSIVTGSNTAFVVVDSIGNIVEQNLVTGLVINRVRQDLGQPVGGTFLFAGTNASTNGRFGLGQTQDNTRMIQWIRELDSANTLTLKDIVCVEGPDSLGLNAEYVVCGGDGTAGVIANVRVDETGPGTYSITERWKKQIASSELRAVVCTDLDQPNRIVYAVGTTSAGGVGVMGMQEGLMTAWTVLDGVNTHKNVFGHDMDEEWVGLAWDYYHRNLLTAGWSESHSDSRDAIFFRYDRLGFGTGVYNLTATGTSPYYYNMTSLATASNTATLTVVSAPGNTPAGLTAASYSPTMETSTYTPRDFDGAFGPNGNFTGIIAYFDLDKFQEFQNSEEFKLAQSNCDPLIYISNPDLIGGFYQFATVGDGSADDGNIFNYDVIKHSNGMIYSIGQTSGEITKFNTGNSGVYDYLIVELDPGTGELEFYQNGTTNDEETYALTELADGRIAYVGRTTGDLGGQKFGGYDVFLGIFNTVTEVSDYFVIGSGLDDVAVNVHDLGNNELAVVYFTYGSLTGTTNTGSQDIGVVKFNYSTKTWGTAYQTGSNTSEIFQQNGKPSALLSDQRIAVTCSTAGVFADNAGTYGYLDVALAILDLGTGTWTKYQVGTTANEISSSASTAGDIILIGGNAGGSFDDDVDAIFVEFDALRTISGRSSSV